MHNYLKNKLFVFIYWVNALLYGLVYFYPYNEYGEPQIPIGLKFIFDLLIVLFIVAYGIKIEFKSVKSLFFIFLLTIMIIGVFHIHHTSLKDFLHYTIRNLVFYSLIFFINIFNDKRSLLFHNLHYKVFKFILYFGVVLFLFKILGINNPFGFHYWFWEKNRLITSWLNPNSLGFYLLFYLIYEYYLHQRISLIFLLTIFSIFLTGSLTAMVGVGMVLLILLCKFFLQNKIKPIYILFSIISIPVAIYAAINLGVFDYLLFKIDTLFINRSSTYTSVSTRVQNLIDLYNYFYFDNILSILLGDFSADAYNRLDSQYLNIFYNYGLIGLAFYLLFHFILLIKLYNGRSVYSKSMFVFSIWLFFIAYNLTAYVYRSNISFFYYVMLSFILYIESVNINTHTNKVSY